MLSCYGVFGIVGGGGGAYCFLRYTFLVLGNDSDVMI